MREREWYFLFKWLWGPDDQIMEIETPRSEYPGQWPEYPGVTGSGRTKSPSEVTNQFRPFGEEPSGLVWAMRNL